MNTFFEAELCGRKFLRLFLFCNFFSLSFTLSTQQRWRWPSLDMWRDARQSLSIWWCNFILWNLSPSRVDHVHITRRQENCHTSLTRKLFNMLNMVGRNVKISVKLFCTHTQKILCFISGGNNFATSSKDEIFIIIKLREIWKTTWKLQKCSDDLKGVQMWLPIMALLNVKLWNATH